MSNNLEKVVQFYNYKEKLAEYKEKVKQRNTLSNYIMKFEWDVYDTFLSHLGLREDSRWIETSNQEQRTRGKHYYERRFTTRNNLSEEEVQFMRDYLNEVKNPGMESVFLEKESEEGMFTTKWVAKTYADSGD